jgi:hypothetical protein
MYGWNSMPVAGTDIIRLFVAKGRVFPFPIDLALDNRPPTHQLFEDQPAITHSESMYPVLKRQREILSALNEARREHHCDLKNKSRQPRTFEPGEIVIVRRETQTNITRGVFAKQQMASRGPYIVLQQDTTPGSYWIRRIPFAPSPQRVPGKERKAKAERMNRLLST